LLEGKELTQENKGISWLSKIQVSPVAVNGSKILEKSGPKLTYTVSGVWNTLSNMLIDSNIPAHSSD
jgi:hypothetical protein